MFKSSFYDKGKKGGGSREPLPFYEKQIAKFLFYLSSFNPFCEKRRCRNAAAFFYSKVSS